MQYIAYYRVSTDRQGRSGLGLDAQRAAVAAFLPGRGEQLAEFTEIESGKKNDRPKLTAALALCRQKKARLIIAKLDRLARNVAFIANLMDSGVDFVACDMPEANRLTLHILAAVAEHEREMISKRTKEALAAGRESTRPAARQPLPCSGSGAGPRRCIGPTRHLPRERAPGDRRASRPGLEPISHCPRDEPARYCDRTR